MKKFLLILAVLLLSGCQKELGSRTEGLWELNEERIVSVTGDEYFDIAVPSLSDCNTIDTDVYGVFSCGTDEGGSGSSVFTSLTDKALSKSLKSSSFPQKYSSFPGISLPI